MVFVSIESTTANTVVVHIVEDDPDVRLAVASLLRVLQVEARAYASAEEFLAAYDTTTVGCLILDLLLPGSSGLELLSHLARTSTMLPTLVLSGNGDIERVVRSIQRGAVDFLEKPVDPSRLLAAVGSMAVQAAPMAQERRELRRLQAVYETLTAREREVHALLAQGMTAKQIARLLKMSIRTAHIHRTNVMRKFGSETLVQLADQAAKLRLARERATQP